MSQKDLEAAIAEANTQMIQAKEIISWAHSVLNDPATNLGNYDLTQDETNELMRKMRLHLEEVHSLSVSPPTTVSPSIPPWDAQHP